MTTAGIVGGSSLNGYRDIGDQPRECRQPP